MRDLTYMEDCRWADKELEIYGHRGDEHNGLYKVKIGGRVFIVIASNGGGWDHVSVHLKNKNRVPTWEEMCRLKDIFFEEDETVVQFHPPKSQYVNIHEYVLHLWRPQDGSIKTPPKIFV